MKIFKAPATAGARRRGALSSRPARRFEVTANQRRCVTAETQLSRQGVPHGTANA